MSFHNTDNNWRDEILKFKVVACLPIVWEDVNCIIFLWKESNLTSHYYNNVLHSQCIFKVKIRINQRDTTIHVQIVNKSQTIILPHRNLFQITVGIANKGRQLDRTDPSSYLNQKSITKKYPTNRIFKTFIYIYSSTCTHS